MLLMVPVRGVQGFCRGTLGYMELNQGFPKLGVLSFLLGVPRIRTLIYWGLYECYTVRAHVPKPQEYGSTLRSSRNLGNQQ